MRGDDETPKAPVTERKIFGTDGVRGLANAGAMTPERILRLGMAVGRVFRNGAHRHRVVIGKDTRLSGYMIEPALTAGFAASGMDVFLLGPLPTPAMAMLTRSLRADLGVMISASHNPYQDNGVKFFGPDGFKLSDETELEIERLMEDGPEAGLAAPADLGRVKRVDDAGARYIEFAKAAFPRRLSLEGLRVVVDCANGAAYKVAPTVLWELGAEVKAIGVDPNGFNINRECGSTATKKMQDAVLEYRADIGVALDGDADRVIICDEKGRIIDGDQILALIADMWKAQDRLRGGGVVSTVMANMGLEKFLAARGLTLERTRVGDRYVVEAMRAKGMNVGGEPSGHVILSDYATTGDGLVTALQALAAMAETGKPASAVCRRFEPLPSLLENLRYCGGDPLADPGVKAAIAAGEERLGRAGRLVIRKSGTEPVIRVMGEADDAALLKTVVADICAAIEKAGAA
ncbi:phosphoglucosamine mutase [Amphiplicatus metriothermophilus]|uniref:Phosphoglucosamine mutase n=1 Tax=Amphiplicatus metriothermophilus TaxID=1519374 RepID=A0A239PYL6_9PROT|nr:phosphoglucosamine mutase [Amphiplicatus metriothermophilus]MBB5518182.1 phosphoglucosamine mutase [Amphiplicatus metriothermophilus]SNT75344.1 phosphoglucosamine mutase [Amphiplicatus metriothermophilus]